MPRETSKTRQWEQERRNRLNEGFLTLSKLLPSYEPAAHISKVNILHKAASHIEELQSQVNKLLETNGSDKVVRGDVIKKLQERVKKLIGKNEQLASLLREAKITIPPGCSVIRKIKCTPHWSNRLTPEQAKSIQTKEEERKINQKVQQRKFLNKNQSSSVKTIRNKSAKTENKKIKGRKKKLTKIPPKCVIVLSQPNPIAAQPCFVFAPSNNFVNNQVTTITTTSTGSTSSTTVESNNKSTVSSSGLAATNTLILTNTLFPVLQQPASVFPLQPRIIPLNPRPTNSVIIVSKSLPVANNTGLPRIKPKYCTTKTTQVNKVPIPALTPSSSFLHNNKDLAVNKNSSSSSKSKTTKVKKTDKENKDKVAEKRKLDELTPSTIASTVNTTTVTTITTTIDSSEKKQKLDEKVNEQKKHDKVEIDVKEVQKPAQQSIETQQNNKELPSCNERPNDAVSEKTIIEEPTNNNKNDEKKTKSPQTNLEVNIDDQHHSELSNDIFASLQVPSGGSGGQNPESTSPTAAFLLAFPLVSTGGVKVTEVTVEEDNNSEGQRETPNLLQIGTMDTTKPTQSDSLTPSSLLNLDNLSFFSSKELNGFYSGQSFDTPVTSTAAGKITKSSMKQVVNNTQHDICQNLIENYDAASYRKIEQRQHHSQKSAYLQHKDFNISCNNFNHDNIKTSSYSLNINSSGSVRNYPDPLYTNSNNSYYYNAETNFCQNNNKNIKTNPKTCYDSYTNNNFPTSAYYNDNSNAKYVTTTSSKQTKAPINWMTTIEQNTSYILPFSSSAATKDDYIYTSNTQNYFNTTTCYSNPSDKLELLPSVNSCYPPPPPPQKEIEENQFSWSPPKLPQFLDAPHSFVTSTLPTLIGDLALGGNTTSFVSNFDTRIDNKYKDRTKEKRIKYDSNVQTSNFLSVSQLVEHSNSKERSTRRSRVKNIVASTAVPVKNSNKKKDAAKIVYSTQQQEFCDNKTRKNSYSAEALIGNYNVMQHQQTSNKQQNYTTNKIPFLPDSIIPYLPPVDLPTAAPPPPHQDYNNYIPQNQNYQNFNHNFPSTTTYPNSFIPNASSTTSITTTITTTACTNNFSHDSTEFDLNLYSKDKNFQKTLNHSTNSQQLKVCQKKSTSKKKQNDVFDFPFLPISSSVNSPILPDDFHTHTSFLQPPTPQLYPCKNSLYSKQNDLSGTLLPTLPPPPPPPPPPPSVPVTRNSIHHPEISPNVVGTSSLTNFNLSTIFPEINNKGVAADPYLEHRTTKDHKTCTTSTQVSFNSKPTFSFNYGSTSTSYH